MAKKQSSEKENNSMGKQPWERHYAPNDPSDLMKQNGGAAFNPISGKKRPQTHKQINEDDY